MKLLIEVDQLGSIKAGYDAPHSTQLFDIPTEEIPQTIRTIIIEEGWDPKFKHVKIGGRSVRLVMPLTKEKILAEMNRLYRLWLEALDEDSATDRKGA